MYKNEKWKSLIDFWEIINAPIYMIWDFWKKREKEENWFEGTIPSKLPNLKKQGYANTTRLMNSKKETQNGPQRGTL